MSLRLLFLIVAVVALALYAYRDWFASLCGSILLMAVVEHPDMPKTILGIQGLNLWNIVLLNILVPWYVTRRREGVVWDMPRWAWATLLLYFGVVFVAFLRMMDERLFGSSTKFIPQAIGVEEYSLGFLLSENLINNVKWVIPGLLLFDGCRTQRRMAMALACILGLFVLLAVQVIRWIPPSYALDGHALMLRSRKILVREVGYHAVNLSMMLAGAFWGLIALLPLIKRWWRRIGVVALAFTVAYGQALTAGRMGYAAWAAVGLVLCGLKWRKCLVFFPLIPILLALAVPGSVERFTQGFGSTNAVGRPAIDTYEVTSGRTLIWPYVVEKVMESPLVGYGRLAMIRTGLRDQLWDE